MPVLIAPMAVLAYHVLAVIHNATRNHTTR